MMIKTAETFSLYHRSFSSQDEEWRGRVRMCPLGDHSQYAAAIMVKFLSSVRALNVTS